MKGEITLKILEAIERGIEGAVDLFDVLISTPYGASVRTMEFQLGKRRRARDKERFDQARMQNLHSLLYKLKRDRLLNDAPKNKKGILLTEKGKEKLKTLRARFQRKIPFSSHVQEKSEYFTIVIFDIPEKQRLMRSWLREALRNIGLRMIQKSVWIGKVKIPKEFLERLQFFEILDYVEIFEISKMGSLRHVA